MSDRRVDFLTLELDYDREPPRWRLRTAITGTQAQESSQRDLSWPEVEQIAAAMDGVLGTHFAAQVSDACSAITASLNRACSDAKGQLDALEANRIAHLAGRVPSCDPAVESSAA